MELKPNTRSPVSAQRRLLIVPYGIETRSSSAAMMSWYSLLIVPYGIETPFKGIVKRCLGWLLIVPYGIETDASRTFLLDGFWLLIVPYGIETRSIGLSKFVVFFLLIVPYGIETFNSSIYNICNRTFNRTLWNWNSPHLVYRVRISAAFNRTLWNWNQERRPDNRYWIRLLIVPYGIETILQPCIVHTPMAF